MEGQLKVDAAVFDLCLAEGCVDVAEQDCCRLPLVLTLRVTSCRFRLETYNSGTAGCLEIHNRTLDNTLERSSHISPQA